MQKMTPFGIGTAGFIQLRHGGDCVMFPVAAFGCARVRVSVRDADI